MRKDPNAPSVHQQNNLPDLPFFYTSRVVRALRRKSCDTRGASRLRTREEPASARNDASACSHHTNRDDCVWKTRFRLSGSRLVTNPRRSGNEARFWAKLGQLAVAVLIRMANLRTGVWGRRRKPSQDSVRRCATGAARLVRELLRLVSRN